MKNVSAFMEIHFKQHKIVVAETNSSFNDIVDSILRQAYNAGVEDAAKEIEKGETHPAFIRSLKLENK